MYDNLDTLLIDRIREGYKSIAYVVAGDAYKEAIRLAKETGRDEFEIGERRLHSLQKRGFVHYDADKGWTLVERPAEKSLEEARAEGQVGMDLAQGAAERNDPLFGEKVKAFILDLLANTTGRCMKGEQITDAAVAAGFKVKDARAFGGIMGALSAAGKIVKIGTYQRSKGHATAGGVVWQLGGVWS